ncbi:uncharacterized protein LOC107001990 [Solanum pennellii]|uniref:Uncharacterized protein LOC107001990 n=1 Tax=Solanum pennellii TaxID=28526 RepID=A0ABM1FDN4_SOLPN|nr:uncharacterized protein LOC107001990 [Solanum pennellii]
MATRKSFQFLASMELKTSSDDLQFEFDESDIWDNTTNVVSHHSEPKRLIPTPRFSRKSPSPSPSSPPSPSPARSLPVNIPDWSKIQGDKNKNEDIQDKEEVDIQDKEEVDADDTWIPPHEYLAKKRGASFSVCEGVGRTLKGRDLSRLRDAILKQTGFID